MLQAWNHRKVLQASWEHFVNSSMGFAYDEDAWVIEE